MPTERVVTLYGGPGCSLCSHARQLLDGFAPRYRFVVREIDINSDDELLRRFMFEIPVVEVDGAVIAKAPIRRETLEDAFAEAFGEG